MDFLTAKRGFEKVGQLITDGSTLETLRGLCDKADAVANCAELDASSAWANAPAVAGIPIVMDLPALLITVVMTTLVYIGIREAKWSANAMTILKLGIILLVIFLGATYVNPDNWSPFAPNGAAGVLKGVSAVFFAYIGFDALATTAEEAKNPSRDLPRAMILSLIICTVLYIALALVITGMVSYTQLNVGDPLAFVFGDQGANIPWVAGIIAVSAVIALGTVFLVFQIGQPRLWMAMSRDGLLPKIFSSIHPKFKTPWFATIITGTVVAIPALFMNLTEVTDLASIGTLFAFVVVCAGVLFKEKEFRSQTRYAPYINAQFIFPAMIALVLAGLYYQNHNFIADFFTVIPKDGEGWWTAFSHKIPLIAFILLVGELIWLSLIKKLSLIPIIGLVLCAYLMTELGVTNWFRFGIWLIAGLRIYTLYGIHHSNLNREYQAAQDPNDKTQLLVISGIILDVILLAFVRYIAGLIIGEANYFGYVILAGIVVRIVYGVYKLFRS
jgi:amino acid transporter